MFDTSIDVGSLCVVVVVVVCSWGLSLLLTLTCWNSYKKSQPRHLYCTQCSALQQGGHPIQSIHSLYQYPSYALPPSQLNHYQALPHTAARLGILESGEQPAMLAPVLQSSHGSYSAYTRTGGAGLGVLETVHVPSPTREEYLDQNTTISRSFRSGGKCQSSSIDMRSLSRSRGLSLRTDENELQLTLNERFSTLSNVAFFPQDANISARSTTSAQSKLSQVRILTSPPPSDQGESESALTRTPSSAMRETRKSLLSNISKTSVRRSLLGGKRNKLKSSSKVLISKNVGGARSKISTTPALKDIEQGVLTCETNLETSDEEDFISQIPSTALELGQHHATPVNPKLPRHCSQDMLRVHRPYLETAQPQGLSGVSDWSNPRKDRQVGSPGNTANADYFIEKQTPQLLDIDLERPPGGRLKPDIMIRVNNHSRIRDTSSAPARQDGGRLQNQPRRRAEVSAHNNLLSVKPHKAYKPVYSESDLTSQSEDETRRHKWHRRGVLELPTHGPVHGTGFDLTPPVLDLSQLVPDSASAARSSVPLFATSALSTNPSSLQYSSVSFSDSDISLVVSPIARPPTPSLPQYASSQSSHPMSLDWDNYASDPQFQQNTEDMI